MARSNSMIISNMFRVLTGKVPAHEVTALSRAVEQGSRSLEDILFQLYVSPSVESSGAALIARASFALLGRAPDASLFDWAMRAHHEHGLRLGGLLDIALGVPGQRFSGLDKVNDSTFMKTIYKELMNHDLPEYLHQQGLALLKIGYTRGDLLVKLLEWPTYTQKPEVMEQTRAALTFLAAAGREPTTHELGLAVKGTGMVALRSAMEFAVNAMPEEWYGLEVSNGAAWEISQNNGMIADVKLTLKTGGFVGDVGAELGKVENLPAGLSAKLIKVDHQNAVITFTGRAESHSTENNTKLQLVLEPTSLTGVNVAQITGNHSGVIEVPLKFVDLGFEMGDNTIKLKGELEKDLLIDIPSKTLKFGNAYTLVASNDETREVVNGDVLNHLVNIDASGISGGKGKLTFNGSLNLNTTYHGSQQGDVVKTGAGGDNIFGGNGNDTLNGGGGQLDVMRGGLGNDTFVFGPAPRYFNELGGNSGLVNILDFGVGNDALDFSQILGYTRGQAPTVSTPLKAVSVAAGGGGGAAAAGYALTNGGVALVDNNGRWLSSDNRERAPTKAEVAALFGNGVQGDVFAAPTDTMRAIVMTADLRNGADVWLIQKETPPSVTKIAENEIYYVGHIDGSWNVMLSGVAPVTLV